ncbi:LCP family protein [Streptomyces beigongshangae]|uniref:LCP family protein n=1 Tax=Streptomyces beigongshangae TaxID=2841597 RepID=UPI001C864D85|nr:LCP family protein [Streptomyces sp. REN17]
MRLTRRGRILVWAVRALALIILAVAGVGAWLYQDLDDNIGAADIDDKLGGDRPANLSPGSKNILVVGSDSRGGDNAEYGGGLDTMQSDSLLVMHVPANREWATVVSFPRDSWVRISACDKGDGTASAPHHAKINEAFAIGGAGGGVADAAACSIRTVEANTGLRIDHFVSVDFQGFKGMVNALDGIEVCPERAIHDEKAHLDLEAGCQTVKDEEALGYVRARYSVGDGSDLGRIGRQQEFMQALAGKAQSELASPNALYGFLQSATKSLTTDKGLAGIQPLYGLASELKGIPGDRLTFLTVPNYPREADVAADKANVVWQYPQAGELFTSLAKDEEVDRKKVQAEAEHPIHASSVRVRVLNGTGVPGRAATVAAELRRAGFTVVGTGNAPETTRTAATYPQGMGRQAEVLASRLSGTRATQEADAVAGVVTLTVGADLDPDGMR